MAPSLVRTDNSVSDVVGLTPKSVETLKPNATAPHEEFQYLDLIRFILTEGEHRPDR